MLQTILHQSNLSIAEYIHVYECCPGLPKISSKYEQFMFSVKDKFYVVVSSCCCLHVTNSTEGFTTGTDRGRMGSMYSEVKKFQHIWGDSFLLYDIEMDLNRLIIFCIFAAVVINMQAGSHFSKQDCYYSWVDLTCIENVYSARTLFGKM